MNRNGVTLLEILLVALLLGIVSSTVWRLFHFGTLSSREGIRRAERTLEGQRIMKQLRADLTHACSPVASVSPDLGSAEWLEGTMEQSGSPAWLHFTFHAFPGKGSPESVIGPELTGGFQDSSLDRITYSLERASNQGSSLYKLVRRVCPGGGDESREIRQELSSHVILCVIRPVRITDTSGRAQWFFNVSLALADSLEPGKEISERGAGQIIVEMYDLVCPVAFAARWNDLRLVPNWYLRFAGPAGR